MTERHTGPVLRKQAHDSGDGETIYHCPFCGSGQVIARSDRTIECQYCQMCFTVQIQPQFPAFPQTINGQPVQVPGMPGEIGGGMPGAPGAPGDPGADPNAPMDPSQVGDDGDPAQDMGEQAPNASDSDDDSEGEDQDSAPPWVSKQSVYITEDGRALDPVNYRYHLAIKNAPDRRAMAARVREARGR